MAISREKKEQIVTELKELLSASQATVFSDYRGLTAAQMGELRSRLRPLDSRFLVAKNTLILRSLEELGLPKPKEMLQGPTALGLCYDQVTAPLKTLMDFARETELLTVKGGLLGDRVIEATDVETLSTLPGLEIVQAQVLGGLQSPMSGLVGLLDAALRGLLYVLDARTEQIGEAAA